MKKTTVFSYALGILLFGAVLWWSWPNAVRYLSVINLPLLTGSFLLMAGVNVLDSFRWGAVTNDLLGEKACSGSEYLFYLITGRLVGLVLPRSLSDFGVKSVLLRLENRAGLGRGLWSSFLDRLFDVFFLVFLIPPVVLFIGGKTGPRFFAGAFVMTGLIYALVMLFSFNRLISFSSRVLLGILRKIPAKNLTGRPAAWVKKTREKRKEQNAEEKLEQKTILSAVLISLLRNIGLAASFYVLSSSLGIRIPFLRFLAALPIVQAGIILAFAPGALGTLELGWMGAFLIQGMSKEDVQGFVVGQRIFFVIFTLLLAIIAFIINVLTKGPKANILRAARLHDKNEQA